MKGSRKDARARRHTRVRKRVRGTAERISKKETLRYFVSRPRGSQIGAWVSAQGSIISSRSLLENKFQEIKQKFRDKEVPLPSFWGGYRVLPARFEFWSHKAHRMHDRVAYVREGDGWTIERLYP